MRFTGYVSDSAFRKRRLTPPNGGDTSSMAWQRQWMFQDIAQASQDENGWGPGPTTFYPYIPLTLYSFISKVEPFLRSEMSVIDVGCGAGDKLLQFHLLKPSMQITGIELNPTMAACANYICPFAKIINGNALAHDYSTYDLIYMYRPIADADLQAALQARCMMQMKTGAVLLVIFQQMDDPMTKFQFPELGHGWTKRGSNGKSAIA